MRLHRFFSEEAVGTRNEFILASPAVAHQVRRVFRLRTGDSIVVFDGSGSDYECRIAAMTDETLTLDVISSQRSRFTPARSLYLCAGVVKKDTFEWITEKATELGITDIIPIMAERSEKKSLNHERLLKIVGEASEQSGRGTIPKVHEISSLRENMDRFQAVGISMVVFHTDAPTLAGLDVAVARDLETCFGESDKVLAVFIGPEGGWSEDEITLFHSFNVPIISLGTQVLRAETAVVAALSKVVFG